MPGRVQAHHRPRGRRGFGARPATTPRVTRDSPPRAGWAAPAWSPDVRSIVYDVGGYGNTDLYVIGAEGRGKVQLPDTPGVDTDPSRVAR